MRNNERRETKVETPPIVSKCRRTQRRLIEARLRGHPLKVNAADLPRRQFLRLAARATALPSVSQIARAETYPTRPITMIVSVAAGGPASAIARVLAERMRSSLGQPIIIENIGGADVSVRPSAPAISSSWMICSLFDWQIKDRRWARRRDVPMRRGLERGLAGEGGQPDGFQFQGKSSPMRLIL